MAIVWIGRITEPYRPRKPDRARGPEPVNQTDNVIEVEAHAASGSTVAPSEQLHQRSTPYQDPPRTQFREARRVEQLMSRELVTIQENDSASRAWRLMLQYRIRHLPVLDEAGLLAGIISDRDLLRAQKSTEEAELITVARLMTRKVLAARPDADLRDVAGAMARERIHCFPVIDNKQKLIGIITSSDILNCLVNRDPLNLWI